MEILQKHGEEYVRRKARFQSWLDSVPKWHDYFVFTSNEETYFTKPKKPLAESKLALVSTAGIHLKSQEPFDVHSEYGDWSYRQIPADSPATDILISDTHYDHSDADQDINCLFPISHALTLAKDGFIGSVATNHYGFMGYVPNPNDLIAKTAPEVANLLKEDGVDIVFLTPG